MNNSTMAGGRDQNRGFLVILEHKMPRGGMDVANEIAAISPSQKLLMITAYEGVLDPMRKPENMKIMPKPFDVDELASTIRELIRE